MENLNIQTDRLQIVLFKESMAESVHHNSLDEDVKTFIPDEVFGTYEEALDTLRFLIICYKQKKGPFVYPVLLKDNENIGYVQTVPLENGFWEVGYHIAKKHTAKGYATEAVTAFLPVIMKKLGISQIFGICRNDNIASLKVLKNCGFRLLEKGICDYHGKQHDVCKYIYTVA